MSLLNSINQKNFNVPSSCLTITFLTIASPRSSSHSILRNLLPPSLYFPSLHFPSLHFRLPLPSPIFSLFLFVLYARNNEPQIYNRYSRYPQVCYLSHHWALVVNNNSCVKAIYRSNQTLDYDLIVSVTNWETLILTRKVTSEGNNLLFS